MSAGGQAAVLGAPEPTWAPAATPEFQRLEARDRNIWTREDCARKPPSLTLEVAVTGLHWEEVFLEA